MDAKTTQKLIIKHRKSLKSQESFYCIPLISYQFWVILIAHIEVDVGSFDLSDL